MDTLRHDSAARVIFALVLLAAVMVVGGTAWAKGPMTAVIAGPGIDEPIVVSGTFDGTGDAPIARLADAMGLDPLFVGIDGHALPQEMAQAPTGPTYRVSWTWFNGSVIPLEIYPAAEGGPLVHAEPGLYRSEDGDAGFGIRGGWYRADDELLDVLDELGVPLERRGAPPLLVVALVAGVAAAAIVIRSRQGRDAAARGTAAGDQARPRATVG